MGKPSWQIFPDLVNELCRRPRGTKGQEMRRGAEQGAVIVKVTSATSPTVPSPGFIKTMAQNCLETSAHVKRSL